VEVFFVEGKEIEMWEIDEDVFWVVEEFGIDLFWCELVGVDFD